MLAGLDESHRRPADLLDGAGRNPRPERRRHQLRTEADAQYRLVRFEARADRRDLIADERIGIGFIDADRPAQHDQEVGRLQLCGIDAIDARLEIANLITALGNDRRQQVEIFKGDVADHETRSARRHHATLPVAASSPGSA